jgi:hypothetical protein
MIDVSENLIPFRDVPRRLPRGRGGKRLNISTVFRWASRGVLGIRLEFVQVGGTRMTSEAGFSRFFARLTGSPSDVPCVRSPRKREQEIAAAEREFDGLVSTSSTPRDPARR